MHVSHKTIWKLWLSDADHDEDNYNKIEKMENTNGTSLLLFLPCSAPSRIVGLKSRSRSRAATRLVIGAAAAAASLSPVPHQVLGTRDSAAEAGIVVRGSDHVHKLIGVVSRDAECCGVVSKMAWQPGGQEAIDQSVPVNGRGILARLFGSAFRGKTSSTLMRARPKTVTLNISKTICGAKCKVGLKKLCPPRKKRYW